MKRCSKCGEPLKDNALFCPKCGEYTDFENNDNKENKENIEEPIIERNPKRVSGSIALIIITTFFVVIVFICKDMGLFKDKKESLRIYSMCIGFMLFMLLATSIVDLVLFKTYKDSSKAMKRLISGMVGIIAAFTLSIIFFINIL